VALNTFSWLPSYSTKVDKSPRILEAAFGDGYSQRTGDGINNNPATWEISIATRYDTEADAVMAFLDGQKGYIPFNWTPPGATAALKFISKKYGRTYTNNNLSGITATFDQVFDL
jgi:phage-related protein